MADNQQEDRDARDAENIAHAPNQATCLEVDVAPIDFTLLARFYSKIEKTDTCWLWTGAKNPRGYGHLTVNGRTVKATHISLALFLGVSVPPGKVACHHCDNPACVRPSHLFVGSYSDNMRDAVAKGRQWNRGRLTVCLKGLHAMAGSNVGTRKGGVRFCRACFAARRREWRKKKVAVNG